MDARSKANRLVLFLKVSLSLMLIGAVGSAHAEYYMVYGAPPDGSCAVKKPYHKKVSHKKPKRVHQYHAKKSYRSRSCYETTETVYYVVQGAPACSCGPCGCPCGQVTQVRQQVTQVRQGDGYYRTVYKTDDPVTSYDPDMATGDDNASTYPDMQIN